MTDWKAGDLAVCVDASALGGLGAAGPSVLVDGRVYEVEAVTDHGLWIGNYDGPGLVLVGALNPDNPDGDWAAFRFRKVHHDKREACETAFTVLLNRSKRKVGA